MKKSSLRYGLAFLVFVSMTLPAKSELWGCRALLADLHPHLIELVSNIEDGTGTIKIQGIPEIPTFFGIEGLARAWRWLDPTPGSKKQYAFLIKVGGLGPTGYYYEFPDDKTSVNSIDTYSCHNH